MPSSIQQSTKSLSQGNRSFSFIFVHLPSQKLLIKLNLLDFEERLEVGEIDLIECSKAFEKSLEQHLPLLLMSTGYVTSICAYISHSHFLHSKFFFLPFGISPRLWQQRREPLKVSLALLELMHSAAHCKSAHKAWECMKTLLGLSYRQRTKQSGESIDL